MASDSNKTTKLAVIFPGIGYHTDKPLLYYSKKIARQNGFEIMEIKFTDLDKSALLNRKSVMELFAKASNQAQAQLEGIDFSAYEQIIFISKSIGTVAASVCAARLHVPAKQVYFTPLEQTFSLVEEGNGLVFFGTADQYADVSEIENLCREKRFSYRIFEGANHSLETGDLESDLRNMTGIIAETEDYLVGSPIYKMSVQRADGGLAALSEYRGKVLLIVNTATGCGFTPQYQALEDMYRKYREKGFEILDFPCNQFGHQAPGTDDEIHAFCTSRYDISFPQFKKIDVNGEYASELFTYLKKKQGFKGFLRNSKESLYIEKEARKANPDFHLNSDIKWNFTKFLVNRYGQVIERFETDAGTDIVEQAVERALTAE